MEADQTMDSDTEEEIPVNMKTAAVRAGKGRQLSPRTRERLGVKGLDLRRPVRPVDREKMRPWLKNHLDSGTVFGLKWLHKEEGTFQVSWRHASRLGWKLETDGDVFEKWARHTGIYKDGDEPEPKRWKANFRCALHSLPDVRELTDPVERRGHNANRTYRFLQPHEVGAHCKRKPGSTKPVVSEASPELTATADLLGEEVEEEETTVEVSEDSSSQHADSDTERNTDEEAQYREIYVIPQSDHDYAVRMGRQEGGESVTKILSEHGSGFVLIKTKKSSKLPSLPTTLAEALDISPLPEQPVERTAGPPSSAKSIKVSRRSVLPDRGKGRDKVTLKTQQSRKRSMGSRLLSDEEEAGKTVGVSAVSGSREGEGQPSQPLGFEALLEAASMARMGTLTSPALGSTATPVTVAEQSASESTVPARQPELNSAPLPAVSSSLVISFLQNLLGSPSLSTVAASPTLSLSPPTPDSFQGQSPVPVIQAKDTSNSHVLHHCTKMSEAVREAGVRGTASCDKESSTLKSLFQDRSQAVTTAAGVFTSLTLPNTSAVNSSMPRVNTSLSTVNSSLSTTNSSQSFMNSSLSTMNSSVAAVNSSLSTMNTSLSTVNTSLSTVNTSLPAMNTSQPAVNTSQPALSLLKPAFSTEHSALGSESVVSGIKSESPICSVTSVKMERLSPTKKEGDVEERVGKWEVMDVHSVTSVKVELDSVTDTERDRVTEFGMKGTPGTLCADNGPTSSVLHADSSSREQQPFDVLHSDVEAAAVTAEGRQCGGLVSHTFTSQTTVPSVVSTSSSSPAQGGTDIGVSGKMGARVEDVSSNMGANVDANVEADVGVDAPSGTMGQLLVVNPSMVVSVAQDNTPILTLPQLQQLLTLCLAQRQPVVLRAENTMQTVTSDTENTMQSVISDTENTMQSVTSDTENTADST